MSGRIIAVVGAGGGVGTSLLAGGMALTLSRQQQPVWLVDLDLERGDLAGSWDIAGERTIDDLAPVAAALSDEHLRRAGSVHPSGVTLLAASGRPGAAGRWNGGRVRALLARLAAEGDVVVDVPIAGVVGQTVVDAAGAVLFVCPTTVAGVRRAARRLAGWRDRDRDEHIGLVAQRTDRPELSTRALGRLLETAVLAELPWSRTEAARLGRGEWPPRGRRPLSAAIEQIAQALP